ncbi:leucine-rich repeat-containing protein kinase family protein [Mucilaginibacter aquaedulcis]|uniref:leucine-rich repeat-containing protein kinase family protein n=1 Tax=Mucilaginibacter aquaedulcis TaxID=1187081 RepID=UPI0025B54A9D|nr:leucine-rich repeat-containing protein kinase family protein [Mucilaginibacter aquaedulcis]MDN3547794.1 leucine-rich repeat-containing protein kinase family protein [Mucilaginibacter aquaedulcis]
MQTLEQLRNGELKGAVSLKLSEGLSQFPNEIFDLADTLEKLDLSCNKLSELPADFGRLKKLKILFCSENLFTVLPEVLADCPLLDIVGFKSNIIEKVPAKALNTNIRWLILTNNKIIELPTQIGNCSRMQKLMLAGNKLKELPAELSNCNNLSLLRIAANQLSQLPKWLLNMPKLSWLAFSGNSFNIKPKINTIPLIHHEQLEMSHQLGEGASGIISKANWRVNDQRKEVAIKIFKGAVTSDGLPEDEMLTYIAAGSHHGLVKLLGQVSAHPEGKQGLVMELISHRFFNLGNPPNFVSCTRDVFDESMRLSVQQVIKIATTIASLAAQLHEKGVMHGDLYAHNILIDEDGNTLFGDFGAACFYDKIDEELSKALERIEVSAYGYLLDDLLTLCEKTVKDQPLLKLKSLRDACIGSDVKARPEFRFIANEMLKL